MLRLLVFYVLIWPMSNTIRTLRNLHSRGEIQTHHVKAAALFELLIYGRSSLDSTVRIQRVDNFSPNIMGPPISDRRLNYLNPKDYKTVYAFMIRGMNLKQLGKMHGAQSNTTAYRRGLNALKDSLSTIATIWKISPG